MKGSLGCELIPACCGLQCEANEGFGEEKGLAREACDGMATGRSVFSSPGLGK